MVRGQSQWLQRWNDDRRRYRALRNSELRYVVRESSAPSCVQPRRIQATIGTNSFFGDRLAASLRTSLSLEFACWSVVHERVPTTSCSTRGSKACREEPSRRNCRAAGRSRPARYSWWPNRNPTAQYRSGCMVQIQSTWFPLIDRNPQTFTRSIYTAKASDYRAATQRVYSSPKMPSLVILPVVLPKP